MRLVTAASVIVAVRQLLERRVPLDVLDVAPRGFRNTGVDCAALALASGGRFVHHILVRDEALGAVILLDSACGLREELAFRHLADARRVVGLDLDLFAIESLHVVGSAVNQSDRRLSTRWVIALGGPPVEILAIRCRGDVLDMIDGRLIHGDVRGAAEASGAELPVEAAATPRSAASGVLIESGLLLLLLLLGGLILPSVFPLALRLPLGLLAGLSLQTLTRIVLLLGA